MVSLQGKQRYMGNEAEAIAKSNYKNTPLNIKRLLGRQFKEPEVCSPGNIQRTCQTAVNSHYLAPSFSLPRLMQIQAELAASPGLKYVELEDGTVGVEVSYNEEPTVLSMEQCVAMMLSKLVSITLEATGAKPGDCVISIPGFYTDAQRQAMLNACEIAQLNCLRLLHEGTAVALEYGMFKSAKGVFDAEKPQNVVFVDLGHAQCSATVASFVTGKLTVHAAAYDRNVGGRNFDEIIARKIGAAFQAKHKADPWSEPKARMKLFAAAEKAKKTLSPSGVTEARISVECLMNDIDFNMTYTLEEFIADAEPLLAAIAAPLMQAVAQSGIAPAEIATVEIVGGSTRLGFVKSRVADVLIGCGVPLDKAALNSGLSTTMNADEAIVRGCAWQAALLSTRFRVKEFAVLEAVSFPIKLAWEPAAGGAASEAGGGDEDGDEAPVSGGATSALVFKKHEATPNAKKVTFRRGGPFSVTAAYDDSAAADLPAGTSTTIRSFQVAVPTDLSEAEGPPKIRVNVKHNVHGIVAVTSAQLMEEIKDTPPEEGKTEATEAKEGMDVDAKEEGGEAKDGAAAAEEPPKKKRFKKVELTVTPSEVGMSRARIDAAVEKEVQMAHQDQVVIETNAARNDVESYIYSQRDALIGDLAAFCTPAEKEGQETALTEAEDWLYYGDGAECVKSVYVEKLSDPKKKGAHAEFRATEARNRDACVKALQSTVAEYKGWLVGSSDAKFAHITEEERAGVRKACGEAEDWLFAQLEAQGKLEASADPVLTTEELGAKRRSLVDACKPVVNKPKPKPPKEEKKEAEPAPEAADAPKEEGKEGDAKEGDAEAPAADAAAAGEVPAEGEAKGEDAAEGAAPMSEDK